MALTLRNTKGSALTYSELDNNFTFITGSVDTVSASLSSRVAAQESFSSSLDTFYATDAQVYAQTASLSASISTVRTTLSSSLSSRIAAQEAFSASLDATYATDAQLNTATASLSASLATSIATVSSSLVSASFVELSSSYNNASASLSASISLLSGSYTIASSSLSASISDLSSSYNTLSSSFIAVSASVLDHATTGSNTFIGNQIITGSFNLTGSFSLTGSVYGNINDIIVSSNTASINPATANFFTVTLGNNTITHISASNIQPGQSFNILAMTGTVSTASFSSNIKQPSGSAYLPSSGSGKIDILSFVSFNSTDLYLVSINNMI